ncbi:hypothetical protein P0136_01830 [Lentisphaerota bacterium ZTH]|nr:hypothetical protein JYG24_07030 [Lentisphaerota bacterium]WET06752.1 hypothetical protein P0136_01830 [Lentisphaerota bacterium ZTH]
MKRLLLVLSCAVVSCLAGCGEQKEACPMSPVDMTKPMAQVKQEAQAMTKEQLKMKMDACKMQKDKCMEAMNKMMADMKAMPMDEQAGQKGMEMKKTIEDHKAKIARLDEMMKCYQDCMSKM